MIIVRNVFIAKPGQASKLAALFKHAAAIGNMPKHRILTDMTGEFNRVVLEYEVADLPGVEAEMKNYMTNQAVRDALAGYTDLYLTGSRELLQVV
jgi:hypothetical protein